MNRRKLIKYISLGALSLGVLPLKTLAEVSKSIKNKILKPDSKKAKRLFYIEDATKSKHKKYKTGSRCDNCKFYKKPIDGYGKCAMASNRYVKAEAWCKSYKLAKK